MKLETRLLLVIGAILAAVFVGDATFAYRRAHDLALRNLEEQADKIRAMVMATRRVYQRELVASGVDWTDKTLSLLPAHALSAISADFGNWDRSGVAFNNVSDRPRNPRNRADAVEMQAIARFRAEPALEKLVLPFEAAAREPYYLYARPIRVEESCLDCHGRPETAPEVIRSRYAEGYGYAPGELRGILSIKMPARHVEAEALATLPDQLGAHLAGLVLAFLGIGFLIRRDVRRPLTALATGMRAVSGGDYGRRVGGFTGEFAELADTFNTMAAQIPLHHAEIKAAQQAARDSEERLRLLLEFTGEGIFGIDRDGRCTFANPACLRLLGYADPGELLGEDIHALVHHSREQGTPLPVHDCRTFQAIARGQPVHVDDEVFWRRDGSSFPVEYRAHPIHQGGEVIGGVVSFTDIGKRRENERAMHGMVDQLVRSNSELERFAYVASHDLQEPLRSVSSYAQLLARRYKGRLDDDADTFIGFMVAGAQRMHALINDLLAYSRVQTRGENFRRVETERVLEAALLNLSQAIAHSGAVPCVGTLPAVTGDEIQLVQVLQNLIGNALKFAKPGQPPRLTIDAVAKDGGWEFAVADDGIGIAPENHQRIFELFQRLHTTTEYPGTGIGLALCKRILERHGGRIWVESEPGKGAVFRFTLKGA